MTWEKLVAAVVVAVLGWIANRARQRRQERDADRVPGLEAARDAEAFKARDVARDRAPDDVGLRVDPAASGIRPENPGADPKTSIEHLLDRVGGRRLYHRRDK